MSDTGIVCDECGKDLPEVDGGPYPEVVICLRVAPGAVGADFCSDQCALAWLEKKVSERKS